MTTRRTVSVSAVALALALAGSVSGQVGQVPDGGVPPPRPVSAAERAAVQLALDYFSRGSAAWIPALSRDSWLKKLPDADARAELEARVGPVDSADWVLATVGSDLKDRMAVFVVEYPSGMETRLFFDLAKEGPAWRLRDLRTWSQRQPVVAAPSPASGPRNLPGRIGALAALALAVGLAIAALVRDPRRGRGGLLAGAGAVALAGLALGWFFWIRTLPAVERADAREVRLAALRDVRRISATSEPEAIRAALEKLPADGAAGEVGRLWKAEWALHDGDSSKAAELLGTFPADAPIPEVEQLRARLAFLKNQPEEVARSYEAATKIGPENDVLSLEAADLLRLMADEKRANQYILESAHDGSRLAEVSYLQAAYWVRQQKGVDAENWFKRGWQLRPVERTELFSLAGFWDLLRRPDLWKYLQLDSSSEPVVKASETSQSPVDVPAGTESRLCGAYLRFRKGKSRFDIPGGAALAPKDTPVDDAGGWSRAEEKEALDELPKLLELSKSGASLLQPLLGREIESAARTLADRRRWEDLVHLTDRVSDVIDRVPSDLVMLRAEAFRRLNWHDDGRALLEKAASSDSFVRRASPGTLFGLARALNSVGDYDRALKFAESAAAKLRVPVGKSLLQRIKMEQRLASSYSTYDSEHFSIRYPKEHPESGTRKLAAVLEGERERLRRWIPVAASSKTRTEVQLLWFRDFVRTFAEGMDVVGLFDGKIRLPFAGGESIDFTDPEIVAIVTHELAHAMICEVTLDQAPNWLHEGLAQHVEMRKEHFNPLPVYEKQGRFLALPVVEGVLDGFPAEDLAEISYEQALWSLHFLEKAGGPKAIPRLLSAFREGATTEEALKRLSYKSVPDFDARLKEWSRQPAAAAWSAPVLRYIGDQPRAARAPDTVDDRAYRMRLYDSADNPVPVITPVR